MFKSRKSRVECCLKRKSRLLMIINSTVDREVEKVIRERGAVGEEC